MDLEKLRARFADKYAVQAPSECWLWTASVAGRGYGQIKIPGERRQIYAHRLSYLLHKGEIPAGLDVCHRCDTPRCVNPEHLFLGTRRDNVEDMRTKGRGIDGRRLPSNAGAGNNQAKLTERQVREIRRLLALGISQRKIGRIFGVSGVQIGHIASGQNWSHVR